MKDLRNFSLVQLLKVAQQVVSVQLFAQVVHTLVAALAKPVQLDISVLQVSHTHLNAQLEHLQVQLALNQ